MTLRARPGSFVGRLYKRDSFWYSVVLSYITSLLSIKRMDNLQALLLLHLYAGHVLSSAEGNSVDIDSFFIFKQKCFLDPSGWSLEKMKLCNVSFRALFTHEFLYYGIKCGILYIKIFGL